jgi:hypothetical protein
VTGLTMPGCSDPGITVVLAPFAGRFYTLALQPMSRNPYLRGTTIL